MLIISEETMKTRLMQRRWRYLPYFIFVISEVEDAKYHLYMKHGDPPGLEYVSFKEAFLFPSALKYCFL